MFISLMLLSFTHLLCDYLRMLLLLPLCVPEETTVILSIALQFVVLVGGGI